MLTENVDARPMIDATLRDNGTTRLGYRHLWANLFGISFHVCDWTERTVRPFVFFLVFREISKTN